MICPDFLDPKFIIFSSTTPNIIYYSHIPAMVVSLGLGIFVYFKNRKDLASKILLAISIVFFLWTLFSLFAWTNNISENIIFLWSFWGILYILLYEFCFYFFHVFTTKRDLGFKTKLLFFILLLPTIILTPTKYSVDIFDLSACGISSGERYFENYYYIVGFLLFLAVILFSIIRYNRCKKDEKKQVFFLSLGVNLFMFSFFVAGFLASFLVDSGFINDFGLEQYGLFGMTFFMGMLVYLIVKFKAFNIKLLGAQALVISLIVLIASQFFFINYENITMVVLVSITVLIAAVFGMFLIDSVKKEEQRKDELQEMSNKLAGANDQLRKLDNAKSEFISIASHQLRTPLTAIKGFISLLLEGSYGKVEAKQQEVLNKVYTSNDRLINLVEDLLNVSRMESGRMQFSLAPTDMKAICKEVMDTFYIRAKDAKLTLDYKPADEELPKVMVDGIKMKEVISNLVDNAIKYCPKGGVSLALKKATDDKGQEFVRVIVSDTGIGIPQEEIPYLFAKFSRGKDISRLNTGGTGLGLYVGKGIVEANGSRLWAESDGKDKGSRFIVEIPVNQDPEVIKKWS